jgi:signal transduction histidine kinase
MNAIADPDPSIDPTGQRALDRPWWRQARSLKVEIALAFGIVIALMLALGLTFHFNDQRSAAALDKLLSSDGRVADLSLRSELAMAKALDAESDFLLALDRIGLNEARERHLLPMQRQLYDLQEYLMSVRILSSDPALRAQVAEVERQARQYEQDVLAFAYLYGKPGQVEQVGQVQEKFDRAARAIEDAMEDMHTSATKRAIETRGGVERAAQTARRTAFVTVAIATVLGVLVALVVWRRITGSVAQLVDFSRLVAAGDFSARAPSGGEREFAVLAHAMNQMAESLEQSQAQLLATARRAGMAEIATNVLHNVGNILNSVNVSASLLDTTLRKPRAEGLARAVELMNQHADQLGTFMASDTQGKLLPGYLGGIAHTLAREQAEMLAELERLVRSIDHIKAVVATQQSYAVGVGSVEPVQMRELLADALRINADQRAHQITVLEEFEDVPLLRLDRGRVLQILVNLISNATHAMEAVTDRPRRLTLRLQAGGASLRVCVRDDGEGISPENLTRIFAHGFTTRKTGHGFGLHSCALAARQMGGTLTAQSEGAGKGAAFTLEFPVDDLRKTP